MTKVSSLFAGSCEQAPTTTSGASTMPKAKHIPHTWFDTPNIHLCTFKDFEALVETLNLRVIDRLEVTEKYLHNPLIRILPNLLAPIAFYRLGRSS